MLEFEHIVQVNDASNPRLTNLSREELWQGLVLRAKNPEKFNHALDCSHETVSCNEFVRTIEAGNVSFYERVNLYPQDRIITRTIQDVEQINARSEARIEEPQRGALFVRFSYKRDLEQTEDRVDVAEHLKAAYVQIDRDAIAMIRMLAESKLLDNEP